MADNERKKLTWTIKKKLFHLSSDELLQLARLISEEPAQDKLVKQDEESCIDYLLSYMESTRLLESDDCGTSKLNELLQVIDEIFMLRHKGGAATGVETDVGVPDVNVYSDPHATNTHPDTTPSDLVAQTKTLELQMSKLMSTYDDLRRKVKQGGDSLTVHTLSDPQPSTSHQHTHTNPYTLTNTQPTDTHLPCSPHITTNTEHTHLPHRSPATPFPHPHPDQHSTHRTESMIALKDLPFLQKKEFKVHGGQIGDNASDVTYSNLSKQIDQGLREMHTEGEIIRAVFRIIKPGNFKDMLSSKDDMTISELKSFLQSHLGEKSSTELFQELISAKQHEHETPQQFLYRTMGLKQKVIFMSRQADSDIRYEAQTAQNVFLRTVYQGLNEKHDDIRRELKPLLSDPAITDDALLRQVNKTTSEETERKRRLGRSTRPKTAQAHSGEVTTSEVNKVSSTPDTKTKDDLIQQLSAQVQALTEAVTSLQSRAEAKTSLPEPQSQSSCMCSGKRNQSRPVKRERPYGCPNCVANGRSDCNHCFACGEEGHRAVGCLKKPRPAGNSSRSQQRDHL